MKPVGIISLGAVVGVGMELISPNEQPVNIAVTIKAVNIMDIVFFIFIILIF